MVLILSCSFYIVIIGLEQEPNNGKTVESEPKINNFGSATLEKKLFSNAFNALDRCDSKKLSPVGG